jgi:hypothetical protein
VYQIVTSSAGRVQLVGVWQRIVSRKRAGKDGNWLIEQVEDHTLDRPPQWPGQGLDLIP